MQAAFLAHEGPEALSLAHVFDFTSHPVTLGSSQRMVVECKQRVSVSRGLCPDLVAATEKGGSQWPGWCDWGESARW